MHSPCFILLVFSVCLCVSSSAILTTSEIESGTHIVNINLPVHEGTQFDISLHDLALLQLETDQDTLCVVRGGHDIKCQAARSASLQLKVLSDGCGEVVIQHGDEIQRVSFPRPCQHMSRETNPLVFDFVTPVVRVHRKMVPATPPAAVAKRALRSNTVMPSIQLLRQLTDTELLPWASDPYIGHVESARRTEIAISLPLFDDTVFVVQPLRAVQSNLPRPHPVPRDLIGTAAFSIAGRVVAWQRQVAKEGVDCNLSPSLCVRETIPMTSDIPSEVHISVFDNAVSCVVHVYEQDGCHVYTLHYSSDGYYTVVETNNADLPDEAPPLIPVPDNTTRRYSPDVQEIRHAAREATYRFDLLTVYSNKVFVLWGNNADIAMTKCAEIYNIFNTGLVNSQVSNTMVVNGVYCGEVPDLGYENDGTTEFDSSQGLNAIKTSAYVTSLRDSYGGDAVQGVFEGYVGQGICGRGYYLNKDFVPTSYGGGGFNFANYAYCVNDWSCISGFTLNHEVGHNMAGCHDQYEDCSGDVRVNTYNIGWHFTTSTGGKMRTIMAYQYSPRTGNPVSHTRVNYFSNPAVLYNGGATGTTSFTPAEFTHTAANFAQTMITYAPVYASWKSPPTCPTVSATSVANGATFSAYCATPSTGQACTYTCKSGYWISGTSTNTKTVTCQSSFAWSPAVVQCVPLTCPTLTPPTNGYISGTCGNTYQTSCTIACNTNYVLVGGASVTCGSSAQWSTLPTCSGTCPTISNTQVTNAMSFSCSNKIPTNVCTYTCQTGYVISGSSSTTSKTLTCQSNLSWTSAVNCVGRSCTAPTAPANGAFSGTCTAQYPNTCTVVCNSGYVLSGSSTISCQSGGTWSTMPTCNKIDCSSTAAPTYSTISCTGTKYLDTCSITCNVGYVMTGTSVITCQASGAWTTKPSCADYAECAQCGAHTTCTNQIGTTTANCVCAAGYAGNPSAPNYAACTQVTCPAPPSASYATAESGCAGRLPGQTCSYTCAAGYTIGGTSTGPTSAAATCTNTGQITGVWNSVPTCSLVPATWITGTWGDCSVSCGPGTRTRTVTCKRMGVTVADSQCTTTKPAASEACNLGTCPTTGKADGETCSSSNECLHLNCVDSVCCNVACNGACMACNLAGNVGKCTAVPVGTSDSACPTTAASTCGTTGKCAAGGVCAKHATTVVCNSAKTCSSNMLNGPYYCDGLGSCVMSTSNCGPYLCSSSTCPSTCVSDAACVSGYYCSAAKTCVAKSALGATCSANNMCVSGYCTEGVCCNSACTNACMSCKTSGFVGTCMNLLRGVQPRTVGYCAVTAASTCGTVGSCNGAGACLYWGGDTSCSAATCSGSMLTPPRMCSGTSATCVARPATTCAPYVCAGDACASSCADDTGCVASAHCDTSKRCVYDSAVPSIASFTPTSGFMSGSTQLKVTLGGSGLPSASTRKCRFNKAIEASATYISDTLYSCLTPSWAPETPTSSSSSTADQDQPSVSLEFSADSGATWSPVATSVFTYYRVPVILGIEPSRVSPTLGGSLLVKGSDFSSKIAGKPTDVVCYYGTEYQTSGWFLTPLTLVCPLPKPGTDKILSLKVSLDKGGHVTSTEAPVQFQTGADAGYNYVRTEDKKTPEDPNQNGPEDSPILMFVLVGVGGLLVLGLVAVAVVLVVKKKKNKPYKSPYVARDFSSTKKVESREMTNLSTAPTDDDFDTVVADTPKPPPRVPPRTAPLTHKPPPPSGAPSLPAKRPPPSARPPPAPAQAAVPKQPPPVAAPPRAPPPSAAKPVPKRGPPQPSPSRPAPPPVRAAPAPAAPPPKPKHKVLYDYVPAAAGELAILAGQTVVVTVPVDSEGWAKGYVETKPNVTGFFPWSYCDNKMMR